MVGSKVTREKREGRKRWKGMVEQKQGRMRRMEVTKEDKRKIIRQKERGR